MSYYLYFNIKINRVVALSILVTLPLPPHIDLTGASGSSKNPHEVKLPDPCNGWSCSISVTSINYYNLCIVDPFPASSRKFSCTEIEDLTTSFNDLIRKGAFGKVYQDVCHGTTIDYMKCDAVLLSKNIILVLIC